LITGKGLTTRKDFASPKVGITMPGAVVTDFTISCVKRSKNKKSKETSKQDFVIKHLVQERADRKVVMSFDVFIHTTVKSISRVRQERETTEKEL
jgi:hypothetical protein